MGTYIRLVDYKSSNDKEKAFHDRDTHFVSNGDAFSDIPGKPYAYWVSDRVRNNFLNSKFGNEFDVKAGICTGENETFIKFWFELDFSYSSFMTEQYRYVPHNKGGEYRKWYGNRDYFLKYSNEALRLMETKKGYRHDGKEYYFRNHVGWSKITSSRYSFRYYDENFTFDSAGLGLFPMDEDNLLWALAFLNSNIATFYIGLLNPTLNVTPMVVKNLPAIRNDADKGIIVELTKQNIEISKEEWDEFEISWDFKCQTADYLGRFPQIISDGNTCHSLRSMRQKHIISGVTADYRGLISVQLWLD